METDLALQTIGLSMGVGLMLTVIARKYELPTIVLLLAAGVAIGPAGLGWIAPESLGPLLPTIVSLSIGMILFEGGLTLKVGDYLESPRIIKRLLTVGAMITWLFGAAAVKLIFDASYQISLLAGSLVIVTGPTVIVPLMHRLRLRSRLGSILHWEGVLIDAVGVFAAVFCYELVVAGAGASALGGLALRLAVGLVLGPVGGFVIQRSLDKRWIPESLTNPFALAAAVLLFVIAETIAHEAGLLAVTVAGIIVARSKSSEVRRIQTFKAEMTDLLIGTLFLLLVSRLDPALFFQDGWALLGSVAIVMLIARPLSIFFCSISGELNTREKLFLSWVAPRGIVAASMASLFALQLADHPRLADEALLMEKFVYTTICATVVLQGLTAGWWARLLGVTRPKPTGWLIVGAHLFARELSRGLKENKTAALLADTNRAKVKASRSAGVKAIEVDAREAETLRDDERFDEIGYALALTDNSDLNEVIANSWRPFLGSDKVFAWAPSGADRQSNPVNHVFENLPRPNIVSEELEANLARVQSVDGDLPELATPLFRKTEKEVLPCKDDTRESKAVLALVRQGNRLHRAINRGSALELEVSDLETLFEALCEEAALREPLLDQENLLASIAEREKAFPAYLGHGVAAPHMYHPEIASRICIAARLRPPLEDNPYNEPLRYVFLIISPINDAEGHLDTLSEIAHHHGEDFQSIWN